MEIGQKARLIQPIIQGEIIDTEYDKDAKCLRHLVAYKDATGLKHQRWFWESQLEVVK